MSSAFASERQGRGHCPELACTLESACEVLSQWEDLPRSAGSLQGRAPQGS